jgi:NADH:ubiquinone oxidoreductase subunit F (NADH-binding)
MLKALEELRKGPVEAWQANQRPPRPLVRVSIATCSLAARADETLAALEREIAERSLAVDVGKIGDSGLCWLEPLVEVCKPDGSVVLYGKVTPDQVTKLVEQVLVADGVCRDLVFACSGDVEVAGVPRLVDDPFWAIQERRLLARCGVIDPESIVHYLATGGYEGLSNALEQSPEEVIKAVTDSTLRGRSGSNFPTGTKWEFLRTKTRDPKYLICNADEGDPGAFVNRILMESDPHAVLEGMLIAARATGASFGFIYIRDEYPLAIERMEKAASAARENGLLGDNVLDSGMKFDVEVWRGAGSYVCGEESGLLASLDDARGMPRIRPPFPADSGVFGQPTNVNNVETYAEVALLMQKGLEWHNSVGTERNRGTKIFSLSGHVQRVGVLELPFGFPFKKMYEAANPEPATRGRALKAVQAGAALAGILPAKIALELTLEPEEFREHQVLMGGGGIVLIDETACIVDLNVMFSWFLEDESCGRCTTCHGGTQRMSEIFRRIARGAGRADEYDKMSILGDMLQWSNCVHGSASPTIMLRSAEFFKDEIDEHIHERRCRAKVCRDLIRYEVTEESDKLAEAAGICPTEAITHEEDGWKIIDERCIRCDACREVAPEAIAVVDSLPPKRETNVRDVSKDARGTMLQPREYRAGTPS